MKKKSIHFWVLYPERSAPSQRFRVELFLPYLSQAGLSYTMFSFLDADTWNIFYKEGYGVKRFLGIAKGFFRRIIHLVKCVNADYVFILREIKPCKSSLKKQMADKLQRRLFLQPFVLLLSACEKLFFVCYYLI